ncbi:hypothetical protein BAUCODRAFT_352069 [Baudoinia panamericana UAMH 10762]|uniref:Uncharacterized protein n=1 Tax=Baudoinia panamericana (strain UAMH 10762) TaxID=717646 RepID=M2NKZ1_BAUPA|nr:uncharacterized protein BAUCODRAFT_352069 [Baudoinia panamericana UAMH 10762]EMC99815.1 hypothetical protein BAUCODRAFT_352069 [Baudoinia panamericana UAMH 10762]
MALSWSDSMSSAAIIEPSAIGPNSACTRRGNEVLCAFLSGRCHQSNASRNLRCKPSATRAPPITLSNIPGLELAAMMYRNSIQSTKAVKLRVRRVCVASPQPAFTTAALPSGQRIVCGPLCFCTVSRVDLYYHCVLTSTYRPEICRQSVGMGFGGSHVNGAPSWHLMRDKVDAR